MPKAWSNKDERQYKHILNGCLKRDRRKTKKCKSIAAATVNKRRAEEGRTELYGLGIFGLEGNRRASNIGMGVGAVAAAAGLAMDFMATDPTRKKVGGGLYVGGALLTATSAAYHPDTAIKIFVGVPATAAFIYGGTQLLR
jgi:hypothetical protein